MTTTPNHVRVALRDGAEAGLDAFLAAPVSKRSPNYAKIVGSGSGRPRSKATMLTHYCTVFGIDSRTEKPPIAEAAKDDRQALLEAINALNERINRLGGEPVVIEQDEFDVDALVTSDEFITEDVAWAVLGRGTNRPVVTRRGEGATNGQLWRMNDTLCFSPEEIARLNAVAVGR